MITPFEIETARSYLRIGAEIPLRLLEKVIVSCEVLLDERAISQHVAERFITISPAEYDWLVDRSHRLELFEPGRG